MMRKLADVLNTTFDGKLSEYSSVSKAWKEAAGDIIFMMTSVIRLDKTVLQVAVYDQTWLTELNFMKGELVERMKQQGSDVTAITFSSRRRQTQMTETPPPRKSMTDREKEYADRLLATIHDEKLRESFRHALYSYFTVYTLDDYLS